MDAARLRAFWSWARVPVGIAVASRVALWLFGTMGILWKAPSRADMDVGRPLINLFFRWDAGWYMQIATTGYSMHEPQPGQRNTFFFPLYPMLARGLGKVLGDPYVAAIVISHVCFVAAVVVLYRFVLERWSEEVAVRTVALVACAPHGVYFSAAYAESLFLLLWVGAFYAAHRQRWGWAGLLIALSGATRLVGPIAALGVGLMALEGAQWRLRQLSPRVLWLALSPLGVVAYVVYLKVAFDQPWAFFGGQTIAGWGASHNLGTTVKAALTWRGGHAPISDIMHVASLTLASGVFLVARRRLGWPLAVFSVATLVVYWTAWYSASRYLLVLFPLFIGLALVFEHRPRLTVALIAGSAMLQGPLTWIFTHADWLS